jgi:hypothetical protein
MKMFNCIAKVRRDIGDPPMALNTSATADGMTLYFDLPLQNINPVNLIFQYQAAEGTYVVYPQIEPGTASDSSSGTNLYPTWIYGNSYTIGDGVIYNGNYFQCLIANDNTAPPTTNTPSGYWQNVMTYALDSINGGVTTSTMIPNNAVMVISGQAWGMFTDNDLSSIIHDSVRQHCEGQTISERYRDANGFIDYRDMPKDLHNLPVMEEKLVVTLSDINCLWIMATDLSTNINIDTVEGTNINYAAMYSQLMTHIEALSQFYETQCGQLGVGMYRIEVLQLRRVSRTTNRLVPLYREREYDDHRYPVRRLPQIDRRDEDASGVPSPVWNMMPL